MGISFEKNISLCFKSDTKIVHFKVNFVSLQAKQQNYALSLVLRANPDAGRAPVGCRSGGGGAPVGRL